MAKRWHRAMALLEDLVSIIIGAERGKKKEGRLYLERVHGEDEELWRVFIGRN